MLILTVRLVEYPFEITSNHNKVPLVPAAVAVEYPFEITSNHNQGSQMV